jgi:phosphate transport system permease protein
VVNPNFQEARLAESADFTAPAQLTPSVAPQAPPPVSAIRSFLNGRGNSRGADSAFRSVMLICALSIFAIVILIASVLVVRSKLSMSTFGLGFLTSHMWNPHPPGTAANASPAGEFGALPFIYATLVSSLLSLIIAVPLAIGTAIFLTEMCPGFLRGPLAFLTELLAAIPSVVYGLWAVFVLIPLLRDNANPFLIKMLGWTGLFSGDNTGYGMFAAGVILAIMILPIISSLTREVMTAVPSAQREAALALGATRWEMIRMGVLRNARIGIVGAIILGLGRAIGETMAVTMVIGNKNVISHSLLSSANTMPSLLANEYGEADSNLYLSALVEIGLVLFVVTIVVNAMARLMVWAVTRGTPDAVR